MYKKALSCFKNANLTLNLALSPISLNAASNNKPKNNSIIKVFRLKR
jgi:hypothetical protein